MGGKGRGEVGKVNGIVAVVPTTNSLGKWYGTVGGWGMAAGKVEVLLVASEFDVGRSAEA